MRLIHCISCVILLAVAMPILAANNNQNDGWNLFQVYNNTNTVVHIGTPAITGVDLINNHRRLGVDCGDNYSTECAAVQPNGNLDIESGEKRTFAIVSNVKSLKGRVFVNGAITLPISMQQTPYYIETENNVVLPVQVNTVGAMIHLQATDMSDESFLMGAFARSSKYKRLPYLVSVIHYSGLEGHQVTTIVVSNGPKF